MVWEPDCYKPSVPSFFVADVDSYNLAVSEFNNYVSEVENYIACLRSAAEDDIRILAKAIENGLK